MCATCHPCGHGARKISTSGTRKISTPTKRRIRKVSGGAYGSPNLATMKPVLQIRTKASGTRLISKGFQARLSWAAPAAMRVIVIQNTLREVSPECDEHRDSGAQFQSAAYRLASVIVCT